MSQIGLSNLNISVQHLETAVYPQLSTNFLHFPLETATVLSSNTIHVSNNNFMFKNAFHENTVTLTTYTDYILSRKNLGISVPASTYTNIFDTSPTLLSDHFYKFRLNTFMTSVDTKNGVNVYFRLSGDCSISTCTTLFKSFGNTYPSLYVSMAASAAYLSSEGIAHEGTKTGEDARFLEGTLLVHTGSVGGVLNCQLMIDEVCSPNVENGTFLEITHIH